MVAGEGFEPSSAMRMGTSGLSASSSQDFFPTSWMCHLAYVSVIFAGFGDGRLVGEAPFDAHVKIELIGSQR
jgi:hypothetical protein